jgi:iron complex outermembrane receptor protein
VDFDAAYQITSRWNASLAASYVDAKLDDARVPCNDSNLDGVPDNNPQSDAQLIATLQGAGQSVALCQSNASINRFPKWNTSLESEYSFPVAQNIDTYIRGLWTYYPENDQTESGGIVAASYNLLNLYLGVRDPGGAWDVSLFGRNVTNTSKILTGGGDQVSSSGGIGAFFGNSGYNVATMTPQREFGVRVRYAFGSR